MVAAEVIIFERLTHDSCTLLSARPVRRRSELEYNGRSRPQPCLLHAKEGAWPRSNPTVGELYPTNPIGQSKSAGATSATHHFVLCFGIILLKKSKIHSLSFRTGF